MSLTMFPVNGSLHATPPFPPAGSRRARFPHSRQYYEGATTSHPRIHGHLLVRFRCPRDPPAFVLACGAPGSSGGLSRARAFVPPAAPSSGSLHVDANGISQVFRRSFLCLCSAPRPRSNRHALANLVGHVGAAPAGWTAKASAISDFGANTQLQHLLPYASRMSLPHTCKAHFRLAGSASTARESNPLDRYEGFQLVLTIILPSCSPDATSFETPAMRAPQDEGGEWRTCLGKRRDKLIGFKTHQEKYQ